jgi:hypoxanthine phosphoribosyltransferase
MKHKTKSKSKSKNNRTYGFFMLIVVLIHVSIINGLEKILFFTYGNSDLFRRPTSECQLPNPPVRCLGMPSGHVEIATMIGCTLYSSNFISLPILIVLIAGISLQRVLAHRHTFLQTIVGFLFGLFYAFVYLSTKGYQKILMCLFFLFLYSNLLIVKLDSLVSEKVPDWVDKNMLPTIEKKRNVPYYFKVCSVLYPSYEQTKTVYMSWKDLEMYLDKMVDNIKKTDTPFDAVVGIKTGGAIISDYISSKLNLPNYKIKVSRKKYNCKKTPDNFIENYIDVYVKEKDKEYMICEGIQDDLKGKNVILIDECIVSGTTMNASIDYLISKQINTVYPTTVLSCYGATKHPRFPFTSIYNSYAVQLTWPWGYDN